MFDNLTTKLTQTFSGIRTRRLTENNVAEAIREVRTALLEADVALEVVIPFVEAVRKKSVGREFVASVRPGDMFVKFVHDELVSLMGTEVSSLELRASKKPAVILMAGLQGTGKTTTVAKLARYLQHEQSQRVATVSADVYRPAAIEQLRVLTASAKAHFIETSPDQQPLKIVQSALSTAKDLESDTLIVDTAGRLAIDDEMMAEIRQLHDSLQPTETLFVVDAMTGQDAAKTARTFDRVLPLTGVVLTKADGDARGGAALSVRAITHKPIKFLGTGEGLDGLELFHPDRLASRILGMGDILGLVEEAEKKVDIDASERVVKRMLRGASFTFDDMREQIKQMTDMGGMASVLSRLPNAPNVKVKETDDDVIRKHAIIIDSMTAKERAFPNLLNIPSRKKRVAAGSGTRIQDVNFTIRKFKQMQKATKRLSRMGRSSKMLAQLEQMMAENK
ncbi:MAG: signal recognition particle protein [Gammaproteobacteria bacterium]|nr:signal recognition particle protein [Gammaproteobacteria bacterium]